MVVLSKESLKLFWDKVNKALGQGPNGDCWQWIASKNADGYGSYTAGGKKHKAHRISFALTYGAIPEGRFLICHKCDNPSCVKPDHLFLGTTADNNNDRASKGRTRNGSHKVAFCPRGHPYDVANTQLRPTRYGGFSRKCRTCERIRAKKNYQPHPRTSAF